MLLYRDKVTGQKYVYIHIPKNGGKHIRKKIEQTHHVIQSYWDTTESFDKAHIPYMKRYDWIDHPDEYRYYSYSRCPYNRFISAFYYVYGRKPVKCLQSFCKTVLSTIMFDTTFSKQYIHFYPQYLFVCNEDMKIPSTITIEKLENIENPPMYVIHDYLDDECIEIINRIYEKDFQLFHYEKLNIDE